MNSRNRNRRKLSMKGTLEFVEAYVSNPYLWNGQLRSADRAAAYKPLGEIMKKYGLPGKQFDVARKIHNLRSSFAKEYWKVKESFKCKSGNLYVPKLYYYKKMMPLSKYVEVLKRKTDDEDSEDDCDEIEITENDIESKREEWSAEYMEEISPSSSPSAYLRGYECVKERSSHHHHHQEKREIQDVPIGPISCNEDQLLLPKDVINEKSEELELESVASVEKNTTDSAFCKCEKHACRIKLYEWAAQECMEVLDRTEREYGVEKAIVVSDAYRLISNYARLGQFDNIERNLLEERKRQLLEDWEEDV